MISQKKFIAVFVITVLVAMGVNASVFMVRGTEQAVVVRTGRIARVINDQTGIFPKWPFLDQVILLDKRMVSLHSDPVLVPTLGNEFITVATMAQWRIDDPGLFTRSLRTEEAGAALLSQMLAASVRSRAAQLTVGQIVGGALAMSNCEAASSVACPPAHDAAGDDIATLAENYGIELKDFRILRVSHGDSVRRQVETRMIAERLNAVEHLHAESDTASAKISAGAELRAQAIISEARMVHQDFLAEADRDIFEQRAMTVRDNQDFYAFFSTMEAYEEGLTSNTTLMVPENSEFFRFLGNDADEAGSPGATPRSSSEWRSVAARPTNQ